MKLWEWGDLNLSLGILPGTRQTRNCSSLFFHIHSPQFSILKEFWISFEIYFPEIFQKINLFWSNKALDFGWRLLCAQIFSFIMRPCHIDIGREQPMSASGTQSQRPSRESDTASYSIAKGCCNYCQPSIWNTMQSKQWDRICNCNASSGTTQCNAHFSHTWELAKQKEKMLHCNRRGCIASNQNRRKAKWRPCNTKWQVSTRWNVCQHQHATMHSVYFILAIAHCQCHTAN